jgi:hypothetical protein
MSWVAIQPLRWAGEWQVLDDVLVVAGLEREQVHHVFHHFAHLAASHLKFELPHIHLDRTRAE